MVVNAVRKGVRKVANGIDMLLGGESFLTGDNEETDDGAGAIVAGIIILFLVVASIGLIYIHVMALVLALRCNKGDTKWIHFILLLVFGYIFIFPLVYYIQKKDCKRVN